MAWKQIDTNTILQEIEYNAGLIISKYPLGIQKTVNTNSSFININSNDNITLTTDDSENITNLDSSLFKVNINNNDSSLYYIKFNITENTLQEERIKHIYIQQNSENKLILNIKQLSNTNIPIWIGSQDISTNFIAIQINNNLSELYNNTNYNNKIYYNNSINNNGALNNIDVSIQPVYNKDIVLYISDTDLNNLDYSITQTPIPDSSFTYQKNNTDTSLNCKLNLVYDISTPTNKQYNFTFSKNNKTVNIHIVNNLIMFIYKYKLWVQKIGEHRKARYENTGYTDKYMDIFGIPSENFYDSDYKYYQFEFYNDITLKNCDITYDYDKIILDDPENTDSYELIQDQDIFITINGDDNKLEVISTSSTIKYTSQAYSAWDNLGHTSNFNFCFIAVLSNKLNVYLEKKNNSEEYTEGELILNIKQHYFYLNNTINKEQTIGYTQ